jgi:hypothetical protein
VLADDGTLWLNLGDSYTGSGKGGNPDPGSSKQATNAGSQSIGVLYSKTVDSAREAALTNVSRRWTTEQGMAPKNLVGIPWRVAFALQEDGWYLRSDIIWHKPNPMPESVTDRPTKAHEYVFLLSKSERYYYDADAIAEDAQGEPHAPGWTGRTAENSAEMGSYRPAADGGSHSQYAEPGRVWAKNGKRNVRTVWTIPTSPYKEAHFATFPPELPERCIKAGSAKGDTVLDPFGGAGTTGLVADRLGRNAILIELNPKYAKMAERRITDDSPLFADAALREREGGTP